MPFQVSCPACQSRMKLSERLYDSRVRGRLASVKCTRCKSDFQVDGQAETSDDGQVPSRPLPSGAGLASLLPLSVPSSEQPNAEVSREAVSEQVEPEPQTPRVPQLLRDLFNPDVEPPTVRAPQLMMPDAAEPVTVRASELVIPAAALLSEVTAEVQAPEVSVEPVAARPKRFSTKPPPLPRPSTSTPLPAKGALASLSKPLAAPRVPRIGAPALPADRPPALLSAHAPASPSSQMPLAPHKPSPFKLPESLLSAHKPTPQPPEPPADSESPAVSPGRSLRPVVMSTAPSDVPPTRLESTPAVMPDRLGRNRSSDTPLVGSSAMDVPAAKPRIARPARTRTYALGAAALFVLGFGVLARPSSHGPLDAGMGVLAMNASEVSAALSQTANETSQEQKTADHEVAKQVESEPQGGVSPALVTTSKSVTSEPAPGKPQPHRANLKPKVAKAAPATTEQADAPGAFELSRATPALNAAVARARYCGSGSRSASGAVATVTFEPSGTVRNVRVAAPVAGTPAGLCLVNTLSVTRIPPFVGSAVNVTRSVVFASR